MQKTELLSNLLTQILEREEENLIGFSLEGTKDEFISLTLHFNKFSIEIVDEEKGLSIYIEGAIEGEAYLPKQDKKEIEKTIFDIIDKCKKATIETEE